MNIKAELHSIDSLIVLASILIPLLVILPAGNSMYFPYLGLGISFALLAAIIFKQRVRVEKTDYLILILCFLFSFFIMYRANSFITFIDVASYVYLLSYLCLRNIRTKLNLHEYVLLPLYAFIAVVGNKNSKEVKFTTLFNNKITSTNLTKYFVSGVISFGILIVIVPMLMMSNPYFSHFVEYILDLVNITNSIVEIAFRILLFVILLILLPKTSFEAKPVESFEENPNFDYLNISQYLYIPKVITLIVLAIFTITQMQFYLSDTQTLINMGYTNSSHTREIFGQLSTVSFIVFLLVFYSKHKEKNESITNKVLLAIGLFLISMGLKSDLEYINNWGFTEKRLWGIAAIVWLISISAILSSYLILIKNVEKHKILHKIFISTFFIFLAVNIANFDYLIYHFKKSTTQLGVDHYYLAELSADSYSYKSHLKEIRMDESLKHSVDCIDTPTIFDCEDGSVERKVLDDIRYLKIKYENNFDIRTFNATEYLNYLDIKDYKTN